MLRIGIVTCERACVREAPSVASSGVEHVQQLRPGLISSRCGARWCCLPRRPAAAGHSCVPPMATGGMQAHSRARGLTRKQTREARARESVLPPAVAGMVALLRACERLTGLPNVRIGVERATCPLLHL